MPDAPKPKFRFFFAYSMPAWLYFVIGALLFATPYLVAHNGYNESVFVASDAATGPFEKAVIFLGQHSVDSSIGIILNRPLSDSEHAKLSPFIRDSGVPVSYGGPIEVSDRLFILEEKPPTASNGKTVFDLSLWDDAVQHTPDLLDKVRASIKNGEQRYRLFSGYAAWGPFQLELEVIARHVWHRIDPTHDIIFQNGSAGQWETLERQQKEKMLKANPNQT